MSEVLNPDFATIIFRNFGDVGPGSARNCTFQARHGVPLHSGDARPVAVFDFDGTLVDSKSGILDCVRRTLVRRRLAWKEPLDWFVGPPAHVSMPQLLPLATLGEHSEIVNEYRALYAETGWSDSSIYPGVCEMLKALKQEGWRLFICTAKRRDFTFRILAHFTLTNYFEGVYADSEDLQSHSKSELLGRLLYENKVDRNAIMVGDRIFDVDAGRSLGLRTIAVKYGYGTAAEFSECLPDRLCATPEEVLATLLNWRRRSF